MNYEKLSFKNGQVLTADSLNHMEDGIKRACDSAPPSCTATDRSKVLSYSTNGPEWVDQEKVLYTEHSLDNDQKAQARANIGAIGHGENINMNGKYLNGVKQVSFYGQTPETMVALANNDEKDADGNAVLELKNIGHPDKNVALSGIAPGTAATDAVNKGQLDAAIAGVSGGGGSGGGGTAEGAVLYTEQDLYPEEQEQARKNIGAISNNLGGKCLAEVGKLQLGMGMDTFVDMSTQVSPDGESVFVLFQTLFGNKVILHNISPGVDDKDAVNVAQLNGAVGAIDTALDSIIAVQAELRGTIAFTIEGTIHTALFGMTWAEWCLSEYNTIGAYIEDDGRACSEERTTFAAFPGEVYQYGTTALVDGATYIGV